MARTVKATNVVFFVVGLGLFTFLVAEFGLDQILANVHKAGWSLLYVVFVWAGIYLLNTAAWRLVLGSGGAMISFGRLFMVTVSGFVINYITPVIALGGEPYKVSALAGSLGQGRSVSAVVLYRMVHLLGHMFLLLTGVLAALLFLSLGAGVNAGLCVAGVLIALVIAVTMLGHRYGVFARLITVVKAVPFMGRAAAKLAAHEASLAEMDRALTEVYHERRGALYGAVFLEYLSRALMGVEVYLILHGVGVEVSLPSALFLYLAYSIVINVMFFIPMNLGAREGGLYLGLESLALTPLLGVYLGIVMRIREFFWILLGLLFILLAGGKRRAEAEGGA
jgi:uncharacterized protein (TIRG00374 family)